jgi:DNA repair protein RadC
MQKLDQIRNKHPRLIREYEEALLERAQYEQIRSPQEIGMLLLAKGMGELFQEELWVMSLNTKNFVVDINKLYKGTVNSSQVRNSEIFRTPIVLNAPAFIVAHNHPSGDVTPSIDDLQTTRNLREAAKLLDIDFLDHIIVAKGQYYSLREKGHMG